MKTCGRSLSSLLPLLKCQMCRSRDSLQRSKASTHSSGTAAPCSKSDPADAGRGSSRCVLLDLAEPGTDVAHAQRRNALALGRVVSPAPAKVIRARLALQWNTTGGRARVLVEELVFQFGDELVGSHRIPFVSLGAPSRKRSSCINCDE